MHRLHVKIFLWFWLGVVVVSGTLVALTELTYSRAEDDRRWREKYAPRVDMFAQQETRILRTRGVGALATYLESFEYDPGVVNYVFDASGKDVLGRASSPQVQAAVAAMSQSPGQAQHVDTAERIIAEKIIDARGSSYVVVVDYPSPSVLNRSVIEFFSAENGGKLDRLALLRLGATLVVAGVFCYVLARHLASPIERLRSATRKIASEQLQTRVDPSVLMRKDELADLGQDFDRMAERIEHLVTAQRQLLGDVSHALRSPLARLNVALGLARQRGATGAAEHLDRIERETERLNALIGQLLLMARVDSGVDLERKVVFDLSTVLDEVATDADYEARNRNCTVRVDSRRECLVEGTRDVLRGAVENVVRNAVRHTAEGTTVQISMDTMRVGDRFHAVVHVRDHGPGVPAGELENLFTPFYRVPDRGANGPHGSGLGLAITRRTFEVFGGTATAVNADGNGLIVTLVLPASGADAKPAAFARAV
jgi:two-component system sensor histidine kinase CpxA